PDLAALFTGRVALGTAARPALLAALERAAASDLILNTLRRERLGPLAHVALDGAVPGPAAAFATAVAADYYAAARRYVAFAGRLGEVLAAFQAAGVPVLVLKGMALAEPLYGNPALRPMDDIDALVRRSDVARARAALEALGYQAPASFAHEVHHRAASMFARAGRAGGPPARLDLHWDLVDAKSSPVAWRWADGVWDRARPAALGEGAMRVLAPTDALLHACVHLTVNHGLQGLVWRLDIAMMARAWRDAIDWDAVVQAARDARLAGIVYAALRCTEATLDAAIPAAVLARLRPRTPRARGLERWLMPRFAALRSIPYQDYVVPLLTMDRARDVAALLFRRLAS
ncbi:MAG: nucleotidyltransferase family protein, partial [Candidatus Rokubacteria bacterium]|nr:nucleotidyltransferase family protein [Candidatus Rokubacteria bacterium]